MEKRKLNFNQPLLSVRRGSSRGVQPEVIRRNTQNSNPDMPPLPYYKSDLKSGPIRNPGVVPFQWEQRPGRPKDENEVPRDTSQHLPAAPKLPPGRIVNHEEKPVDKAPKELPEYNARSQTGSSIPSVVTLSGHEGCEKGRKAKDESSSDDENVTYVDARDTLSRTESFCNCSTSGVSGLDDSTLTSAAAFSDPQTRDFMMGRFLPAAKAVASETPPFASRKHSAAREKPRSLKDVIRSKQSPEYKTLPHNIHGEEQEQEEDDDDDDDDNDEDEYDGRHDMSMKLCGLLPRFCLSTPIPVIRNHVPAIPSTRSVHRRPADVGSCRQRGKKELTNSHKYARKTMLGQHASTNKPSVRYGLGSKNIVPRKVGAPHSFSNPEKRFLNLSMECRDLSASKIDLQKHGGTKYEVLSQKNAEEVISQPNPAREKTLYVDSEQGEQSRNSNSSSSDSRGRNPSVDYSLQDVKFLGAVYEKSSQSKCSDTVDSSEVSTSEKSFQDVGDDLVKNVFKHQDFNLILDGIPQPKLDVDVANHNSSPLLPPLLPNSPSESWLSRTLPSMPSKNASPKPYLANMAFRSSPVDLTRDRFLRTSYGQHMLFQPAEELTPISEN